VGEIMIAMRTRIILEEQIVEMEAIKYEYHEDQDDPPIPNKFKKFQFVECDNYMTDEDLVKFNSNYVINQIAHRRGRINKNLQRTIDETPAIPMNEYRWYVCPLNPSCLRIQIYYYIHWMYYKEQDKVSVEEISEIVKAGLYNSIDKIYKLIIKYNLTNAAFIWDFLADVYGMNDSGYLLETFKEPPFNFAIPIEDRSTYNERFKNWKKRVNEARKDIEVLRKIREEMEEAYIKEGEGVCIRGAWEKAKKIYNVNKSNKEITEYTPSFRKTISENLGPRLSSLYDDVMKEIVNAHKEEGKKMKEKGKN
jgi:hypothetical protein